MKGMYEIILAVMVLLIAVAAGGYDLMGYADYDIDLTPHYWEIPEPTCSDMKELCDE